MARPIHEESNVCLTIWMDLLRWAENHPKKSLGGLLLLVMMVMSGMIALIISLMTCNSNPTALPNETTADLFLCSSTSVRSALLTENLDPSNEILDQMYNRGQRYAQPYCPKDAFCPKPWQVCAPADYTDRIVSVKTGTDSFNVASTKDPVSCMCVDNPDDQQ